MLNEEGDNNLDAQNQVIMPQAVNLTAARCVRVTTASVLVPDEENTTIPEDDEDRFTENLVQTLSDVMSLLDRVQVQEQRDAERQEAFLARMRGFTRYFYINTNAKILGLLLILHCLNNATYAATGTAILKTQHRFYEINEVAAAVVFGSVVLNPLLIYAERTYVLHENPSSRSRYAMYTARLLYYFVVPLVGYQLLKYSAGVKMQIEQHLVAFLVGAVTLYIPMALVQAGLLIKCYEEYFYPNDHESNGSDIESGNMQINVPIPEASANILSSGIMVVQTDGASIEVQNQSDNTQDSAVIASHK